MRRIPGRCYLCGDPCASYWFCIAHLWAEGILVTVDHAKTPADFVIERLISRRKIKARS